MIDLVSSSRQCIHVCWRLTLAFSELIRMLTMVRFDLSDDRNRQAAMAEWLRRLTRNQMGSSRVGSNPTRSGEFFKVTRYSKTNNFVENDHDGIRTHNLLIRSQTPYPLGHATVGFESYSQR